MRISIQAIAAALSMMALQGNAIADDQRVNTPNRALHLSIALQGDQALLDIRTSALGSISNAIEHQMATFLPRVSAADHANQEQRARGGIDLAAIPMDY